MFFYNFRNFSDDEMGNFDRMTRGLTDVFILMLMKILDYISYHFFSARWCATLKGSWVSHGRGQFAVCQFLRLLIGKRRAKS